jgi:hypothetical protein
VLLFILFFKSAQLLTEDMFNRDYDIHGPAGPTAFWKENDSLEETLLC